MMKILEELSPITVNILKVEKIDGFLETSIGDDLRFKICTFNSHKFILYIHFHKSFENNKNLKSFIEIINNSRTRILRKIKNKNKEVIKQ